MRNLLRVTILSIVVLMSSSGFSQNNLPSEKQIAKKLKKLDSLNSVTPVANLFKSGDPQNCDDAIAVCSQSYTQATSYSGDGGTEEVYSTCLSSGETNSSWYIFTAQTTGNFGFEILTVRDYDWALYDISTDGCAGVPTSTPIACNFSATNGSTGMTAAGAGLTQGAGGSPFSSLYAVTAGETYALIIDNWSADATGYTLNFTSGGGYASITDVTPPTITSSVTTCSSPNTITITLSEEVQCASIAANGSDFTVSGTGSPTVTGAVGVNCTGTLTNQIEITIASAPPNASGTYIITVGTGSDGNTILDKCDNPLASGATTSFNYLAPVSISPSTASGCSGFTSTLSVIGAPAGATYSWSPSGSLSSASSSAPIASPTTITTYTVQVSFAGCTQTASTTLTFFPDPITFITPLDPTICGATTNLTASSTFNGAACGTCTYSWNSGAYTASSTWASRPAGTYTVQATSADGCVGNTVSTTISNATSPPAPSCNLIYVTTAGGGSGLTKTSPTDLLSAIAMSQCNNATIKMATGTYTISNPITTILGFTTIEGGFESANNWRKTSSVGATRIYRNTSNLEGPANAKRLTAIEMSGASNFRFQDITIEVANAPSTANYGVSLYGVHMTNCSDYYFTRANVITGNASSGANGTDGVNGIVGVGGSQGAAGDNDDEENPGRGGNGGTGSSGRNGGGGGASNSAAGSNGWTVSGINGGGGGGGGCGGEGNIQGGRGGTGGSGSTGGNGGTQDGNHGSNGTAGGDGANGGLGAAGTAGSHTGGYWVPGTVGGWGGNGTGGKGGSGGGGGGGEDCFCQNGAGSGGGGGGGGGRAGTGGTSGYGGGGTFPVYLVTNGANGNFNDSNLSPGSAGSGGAAGIGGTGMNGGAGGAGNTYTGGEIGRGGNGGAGGKGGNGGNGRAGSNGVSLDIRTNGTAPSTTDYNFNLAGQPIIYLGDATNPDNNCIATNLNLTTGTGGPTWTNLGTGSWPSSGSGATITTQYSSTGRKTIVMNGNSYADIANTLITTPSAGSIMATINTGCTGDVLNFVSSEAGSIGFNYLWTVTDPLGAGTSYVIGTNTADNTNITFTNTTTSDVTFTVNLDITSECCGPLTQITFDVTISPYPTAPAVIDATPTVCQGGSVDLEVSSPNTNFNYAWYDAATGGTLLGNGDTYTVNPVPNGGDNYYVEATNANGCTSLTRTLVNLSEENIDPTVIDGSFCQEGLIDVGVVAVPNTTYNWYSAAGGGSLLQSGVQLTYAVNVPAPAVNTVSVWVTATPLGCSESNRIQVDATITASAATTTWNGSVNSNWFEPNNWSDCVPNCATDAIFPAVMLGTECNIRFSQGVLAGGTGIASVKSIAINAGRTLSFGETKSTLEVCEDYYQAGAVSMPSMGRVAFVSTNSQQDFTQTATATGDLYSVLINNTNATPYINITGSEDMEIASNGSLALTSGLIVTGTNKVIVKNPAISSISGQSVASYVAGNLRRYSNGAAANYEFPVGNVNAYELMELDITGGNTTTYLDVNFSNPANAIGIGLPLQDPSSQYINYALLLNCGGINLATGHLLFGGVWTVTPNSGTANYNLTLHGRNFDNNLVNQTIVKRATTGPGPWTLAGIYGAQTITPSLLSVSRTGYSGFSQFAIAMAAVQLPIELINFDATPYRDVVNLNWATVTEINNDYFTIEKTRDGVDFEVVGIVDGAGNSNDVLFYSLTDDQPYNGLSYYRLKQTDFDGGISYSDLRPVTFNNGENEVLIFPSPVQDELNILFRDNVNEFQTVKIFDANSKLVHEENIASDQFKHQFNIANYESGVYFIHLGNSLNGSTNQQLKFIKM